LQTKTKDIQAQGTGQLHASSNLRLSPDRTKDDNIMMRLDSGAGFEIRRLEAGSKVKEGAPDESDVGPKPGRATTARSTSDRSEEEDEKQRND
jgi:hypothetical protein